MSPQAKLNYKGHYRYPNMCNCAKYSVVSSDQWKIFISPSLCLLSSYPSFLNSDKKWTYAVYNCTCIHKLVAIMRSIMESNLNYWDEVIVTNTFVSNVIQLYPLDQYLYECKCILKNWDEEVVKEEEENYFDINKYVKISNFPNELKTNYRWNDAVKLSVHNFEYFKKVVTCIDSPAYEILCISTNCCTDRWNRIEKTGMPDTFALLNVDDVHHLEQPVWAVYDGVLLVGPRPELSGDCPWCTVLAGLYQHIYKGCNDVAHCPPQMLGSWDCQEQIEALHHVGDLSSMQSG